jgi:hypothetical protein
MGGRTANIHGNVKYPASDGADQLPLGVLQLKVEASQNMLAGAGLIVLHKVRGKAGFLESRLVECLGEPAAVVGKDTRPQAQDARKPGGKNFHEESVSWARERRRFLRIR